MALGSNDLSKLSLCQDNIDSMVQEWKDCLNSFQYVTNNLREWADETTVGEEIRGNSNKLNELLVDTIECIEDLLSQLTKLGIDQQKINQG